VCWRMKWRLIPLTCSYSHKRNECWEEEEVKGIWVGLIMAIYFTHKPKEHKCWELWDEDDFFCYIHRNIDGRSLQELRKIGLICRRIVGCSQSNMRIYFAAIWKGWCRVCPVLMNSCQYLFMKRFSRL